MRNLFLKSFILAGSLFSTIYGIDNQEHLTSHVSIENKREEQAILEEKEWKVGGKIHFEEKGTSNYLGTIEMNNLTRTLFKKYFNIKTDSCADNAKVLIKKENNHYILTHYEEKSSPGNGEEMHATLLYTSKRVDNGHETLKDVYQNLKDIDENLPSDKIPTVEEVAQAYNKIIKPDWKFEISDITFVKGKTGSCIIAKLLCEGRDEIVNKLGNPISSNFLHMSLVNIDFSISSEGEKIDLVVNQLKEKLLNKKIKIADKSGLADLEFGITGSKPQDRIRPTNNILNYVKLDVPYISQDDNYSCATTSLGMAISYYEKLNDKPLDKEFVWKLSNTDKKVVNQYGNDMRGLNNIVNYYGYKGEYKENMEISEVEQLLSKDALVILNVLVDNKSSATHALLVTGYDNNKKIFYINDPANRQNQVLEYSDLEIRWNAYLSSPRGQSHRSSFIIYPNNKKHTLNEIEKQIKVFVFDFDDTLTKKGSMDSVFQILKDTLLIDSDELFILLNEYKTSLTQGNTTKEEFWKKYAQSKKIMLTEDFAKSIKKALNRSLEWDPEMYNLVNKLKEKGYKVVVFSDIEKDRAAKAKNAGLFDIFDEVVLTYEVGYDKPNYKTYDYLLSKIKVNPNECIFIDDEEANIKSAIEKNIHGIVFKSYDDLKLQLDKFL